MSVSCPRQPRILNHFSHCADPRTRPVRYPFQEIILLVFLATICGEEGWEAMIDWANDKLSLLRRFLAYSNGVPSPDTIRRVVERINLSQFLSCFVSWVEEFKKRSGGQVCIDGKSLAHAVGEGGPLHLVSAWCEENRFVMSTVRTAAKSNEITAIQELLNILVLAEGDVVTINAIGCQRVILSNIHGKGADYLVVVKRNQPNLAGEIRNFFDQAIEARGYAPCKVDESEPKGHGRKEIQEVWVSNDIDWLPQIDDWSVLSSIIMVRRSWENKKKRCEETRYYISSLESSPERFSRLIRRHWSIENELHWHLDVTFGEDDSCIGGAANENLRVARMTALEMLRSEKSIKRGLKAKGRRCLRSDDYLEKVLMVGNF
jgi:predicted transposase YbfD/YdcC